MVEVLAQGRRPDWREPDRRHRGAHIGDIERLPPGMHEFVDEIGRGVVLRPRLEVGQGKARPQRRRPGIGEGAGDCGSCGKTRGAVAGEGPGEFARQALKRQVAGPARHRIIADIDEPAGLEMPIDKPAQRGSAGLVDPAIDPVRDDIIEGRQREIGRRGKIGEVKPRAGRCRPRRPGRGHGRYASA